MTTLAPTSTARIDVRQIAPHARHAQVFERLTALPAGKALELISDHDPLPLRAQIERQHFRRGLLRLSGRCRPDAALMIDTRRVWRPVAGCRIQPQP